MTHIGSVGCEDAPMKGNNTPKQTRVPADIQPLERRAYIVPAYIQDPWPIRYIYGKKRKKELTRTAPTTTTLALGTTYPRIKKGHPALIVHFFDICTSQSRTLVIGRGTHL
jgi:hypothetical protein